MRLAQGNPLHVVSEVLGHTSIAITKDVYGHLMEGDRRSAAEAMSRALFGQRGTVAPSVAPMCIQVLTSADAKSARPCRSGWSGALSCSVRPKGFEPLTF